MINLKTKYDVNEKIWYGCKQKRSSHHHQRIDDDDDENVSVGELAIRMMRNKSPNDICQISATEEYNSNLTYHEALSNAIQLAKQMRMMWQLKCDDIVGIVATNKTYLMQIILAVWFNGLAFHVINPDEQEEAIYYLFNKTKPKVIFCDGLYLEKLQHVIDLLNPILCTICNHTDNEDVFKIEDLLGPTVIDDNSFRVEPLKYGPNQTMAILCTSGTTGLPKCVRISNKRCITEFGLIDNDSSSTVFSFCNIDWWFGFQTLLQNILKGNLRIITCKSYTPEYLLEIIIKYKVNYLFATPIQMSQLSLLPNCSKETMKTLKHIFITGSSYIVTHGKCMQSKLIQGSVINIYGSLECGQISANSINCKPTSMGQLFPNMQLKILDEATENKLGPYEIGEICIKNIENNWLGYYGDTKASAKLVDSDNFIHTRDLGFMDSENCLHLSDRCENIFRFQSFYYSPNELEMIIAELPGIQDVCVVGVYNFGEGDISAAVIVRGKDKCLSAMDIQKHVRMRKNMIYSCLAFGVFFVKEIPRNHRGKILKSKIVKMCIKIRNKDFNI